MSYTKPIKQCTDAPLGYQTVNELAASQADSKALLEVEHAAPVDPGGAPFVGNGGDIGGGGVARLDASQPTGGQHDTPKVAWGTCGVTIVTPAVVAGPVALLRVATGICQGFSRLDVGQYFFPLPADLTEFYGEALPLSDDNTTFRICQPVPSAALTGATSPFGIYVSTWQQANLGAGLGFELVDFSFDLVVYANRGTDLNDSLPSYVAASAPPSRYRNWARYGPRSRVFKPAV